VQPPTKRRRIRKPAAAAVQRKPAAVHLVPPAPVPTLPLVPAATALPRAQEGHPNRHSLTLPLAAAVPSLSECKHHVLLAQDTARRWLPSGTNADVGIIAEASAAAWPVIIDCDEQVEYSDEEIADVARMQAVMGLYWEQGLHGQEQQQQQGQQGQEQMWEQQQGHSQEQQLQGAADSVPLGGAAAGGAMVAEQAQMEAPAAEPAPAQEIRSGAEQSRQHSVLDAAQKQGAQQEARQKEAARRAKLEKKVAALEAQLHAQKLRLVLAWKLSAAAAAAAEQAGLHQPVSTALEAVQEQPAQQQEALQKAPQEDRPQRVALEAADMEQQASPLLEAAEALAAGLLQRVAALEAAQQAQAVEATAQEARLRRQVAELQATQQQQAAAAEAEQARLRAALEAARAEQAGLQQRLAVLEAAFTGLQPQALQAAAAQAEQVQLKHQVAALEASQHAVMHAAQHAAQQAEQASLHQQVAVLRAAFAGLQQQGLSEGNGGAGHRHKARRSSRE
jgi:hypothetical protein